jgi:4-amino-4-deoxy-L-arabinose transferase-like glycosyltransferase
LSEIRKYETRPAAWPMFASGAAIAICLFGNLGALGLVGPDEPRYAWIARAMAETGDWVTPRLYGQPWFEKPILYYWAAAVGFLLHLPAEWAARLPSACAAFAAALAIAWLAKKHVGGDLISASSPVLLAPLIFSTSVAAIGFARAATPDMLFSATITLAMASAAGALRYSGALRGSDPAPITSRRDALPLVLFGAFLGLAVLAKGPAAIVLSGGAIALWALATKQWRAAIRLAHPLAIAVFGVVALPWYVVCAVRNSAFLRIFLWQHNVQRYVTPLFQHRQPFWYFGPILLLALLPWTVLLWPVVQNGLQLWREKSWTNSPGFFFACWAVFPIFFFSLSQSKLPGYILPAIPPLALVCAVSVARSDSGGRMKAGVIVRAVGATWIIILIAAGFAAAPISMRLAETLMRRPMQMVVVGSAAFFLIQLIAMTRLKEPWFGFALCALMIAGGVEATNLKILPLLDPAVSARPHAEFMRDDQHPDRILTYGLNRSWMWGLAFYFRRELPEWSPSDSSPALVLTTPDGLDRIRKLGRFSGELEETHPGLVYVPIGPIPAPR